MWHSTDSLSVGGVATTTPTSRRSPPPLSPSSTATPPTPDESSGADVERLEALLHVIQAMGPAPTMRAQIDQVNVLERIVNAAAGLRAAVSVAFGEATIAAQREAGVRTRDLGRGISDQLGLARGISPQHAAADGRLARQLHDRFPTLAALLRAGRISERVAGVVVRECQHLDDELARRVDGQLGPQLPGLGIGKAETAARFLAIEFDEVGYLERHTRAVDQRALSIRPVADGMVELTGLVALRDGITAYAAIDRAARDRRSHGDARTLDQLRADLFVDLLTGRATGSSAGVEFNITIPAESLVGHGSTPGVVAGYGPIPAAWARELLDAVTGDVESGAAVWLRRLFTDPADDTVTAVDRHRRRFHPVVARWIRARDANVCRMPTCDHTDATSDVDLDHVDPYRTSGDSAVANGQVACESYNQLKELPGWTVTKRATPGRPNSPTLTIVTPTGHTYTTVPPPAFGPATRRTPPWSG